MQIWLSTYNMSAHNGITLLLAIFPTLYIPHLWFIFFASVILYFLGPLKYFFPFISPSGYHLFVSMSVMISVSLCLLIWFVFRFHLWMKLFNIPLFLADISFSIIPSQSMHIISNDKISFFFIDYLVIQMVKEYACSAGDSGSISGSGRAPGEGNSNSPQCSSLESWMGRGAWCSMLLLLLLLSHVSCVWLCSTP